MERTAIFVRSRFSPFSGFICDLKKPVIFVCGLADVATIPQPVRGPPPAR